MKNNPYPLQSNCCGCPPRSNGDTDTSDICFCPECGEHCEYKYFDQEGNEHDSEEAARQSDIEQENEHLQKLL
jgi:hypothetical protein